LNEVSGGRPKYDHAVELSKKALTTTEVAELWAAGRGMSFDQAVRRAMERRL